ncbi:circadian clock protein KaiA, partial [Geitlerinema sp. P-1104]|nr:circadian clock protein KaiA [Geitlerinema sp. P-1104]
MLPQLSICTLIKSQTLRDTLQRTLDHARCSVVHCSNAQEFLDQAQAQKHHIDCAILEERAGLADLSQQLQEAGVLLPVVIMSEVSDDVSHDKDTGPPNPSDSPLYHQAEVWLPVDSSDDKIAEGIHEAVEQFLTLSND